MKRMVVGAFLSDEGEEMTATWSPARRSPTAAWWGFSTTLIETQPDGRAEDLATDRGPRTLPGQSGSAAN
ncbi:MAG: hypothetical protein ACRDJF_09820 [Actinomycetota bacterium]